MDYKEKYEQAIKRAKAMIEVANNQKEIYNSVITIFPELKESEDEKIRKDLIKWIEEFPDIIWRGHYKKDVIAWLEKQSMKAGSKNNFLWHDVSEKPDEEREILCEWELEDDIFHDTAFYYKYDDTFRNGESRIFDVCKWAYIDEICMKPCTIQDAKDEDILCVKYRNKE